MAGLPNSERTTLVQINAKITMWVYFSLTADENGVPVPSEEYMPVCRMCKKAAMCRGGSTTNLFTHLKDAHPKLHREAIQGKTDTSKGKSPQQLSLATLAGVTKKGRQHTQRADQRRSSFAWSGTILQKICNRLTVHYYLIFISMLYIRSTTT